jgi:hypothetical protein
VFYVLVTVEWLTFLLVHIPPSTLWVSGSEKRVEDSRQPLREN